MNPTLHKYRNLHLWMIIPMIIMQLGIYHDYWGDFTENAWSVHVHYWTGTVWYIYLIIQPYYATHGQLARHRTYGIIGMFVAGAVCITALSMMYRDIDSANRSAADPARFGPFEPWFFYGVAAVELVMMSAFGFAIIKSIIHRKQIDNHAWWLISSVFIIMMPALGRGLQFAAFQLDLIKPPEMDIMASLYVANAIIIALLFWGAWKYKMLKHPATWLAFAVNVFNFLLEPMGRSEAIQAFLKAMIKN